MKLKCIANYVSDLGTYRKGDVTDDLSLEDAERLMRDSPGSFDPVRPKTENVSATTASDIKAPDRRARGGRRRG